MASRPYLKNQINALERIFEKNTNDKLICQKLIHELEYRKSPRAKKLKVSIEKNIESISHSSKTEAKPVTKKPAAKPTPIKKTSTLLPPKQVPLSSTNIGDTTYPSPKSAQAAAHPTQPLLKPKPPIENKPQDIIRAWTALEVLSPNSYRNEIDLAGGQKNRIVRFENNQLPWVSGEKSLPKKRLFYELILGTINMKPAIEALLKVYSDNRPDMPVTERHSPIASILLDKNGCPLSDGCLAISSFAWGFPIALQGNLELLADWSKQEKQLIKLFSEILLRKDANGEVLPLDKSKIFSLYNGFIKKINLEHFDIQPPCFALRKYQFFTVKTPPEHSLLNSFYLDDLATAKTLSANNNLPHSLKHYLGAAQPQNRFDLLKNNSYLQHLLQPALTPLGRWPGKGRLPLALLQQVAVNATSTKLTETGLLGVNGPPGTGKTTLLRDIVAARLIDRASVMVEYADPETAFKPTNQTFQRSGAKITLFKPDECLKGHEIVVASSNNKAVENVSSELPVSEAIASDAKELNYFKSISDNVLGKDTWGMIAAVLGNSTNRYHFSQNFWRDPEYGLATYLNHASGTPQVVSEPQESGPPEKRLRHVVTTEQPPNNKHEALIRWRKAQKDFKQALQASQKKQSELQKIHRDLLQIAKISFGIKDSTAKMCELEGEAQQLAVECENRNRSTQDANQTLQGSHDHLNQYQTLRPKFLARIFRTKTAKLWQLEHSRLLIEIQKSEENYEEKNRHLKNCEQQYLAIKSNLDQQRESVEQLKIQLLNLQEQANQSCRKLRVPIPNTEFFLQSPEAIQVANLWFDHGANLQRDKVFESAIALHKAFIDCAADPIRQNFAIFTESFGTRSLGSPQKDALISDLWACFFLVVPVVSTTFASVNKMFSRISHGAIGWLLIDEAGQAAPQAAVGGIMRAHRTIAVGDPLQIEPVVTLPNNLTEEICAYFGVDPQKYNAPEASVQTITDAASIYHARFPTGNGYRDVGSPLLVHRRCDSPMFDISNEIAYSNLMVQAKSPSDTDSTLGPSHWLDIIGNPGPDKWCDDEGKELINMLEKLRSSNAEADLYIVTPFVIVQNNIRNMLRTHSVLQGWVVNPSNWANEHVGTVHTVQGREASIVFFVLGAQAANQRGARNWAGSRPNLVNVAVTRAKKSIYVIGNRTLWKSAGVFQVLDRFLP